MGAPAPDVYAYGVIASGTLHRIRHPFPHANGYGEISDSLIMAGGEAANTSIALSRLGLRVMIDGCRIGDTGGGRAALGLLKKAGVDISLLKMLFKDPGLWELVISDGPTRTVFGNYGERMKFRLWNAPSRTSMARARMVCLDPALGRESISAGRMARELNVPYVTIDRPLGDELGRNATALIISHDFLGWKYPKIRDTELITAYLRTARGLVVFTSGSSLIRYGRQGSRVRTFQPPRVTAIDTTGAGDAFRAGVIFGLLQAWQDADVIRYAAAVAAMTCRTMPATVHSPHHRDVWAFLAAYQECSFKNSQF